MGHIGLGEILVLVLVVLVLFGPNKLPEVGKALGRAIGEFKRGMREGFDDQDKGAKTDAASPSKPA